jgi:mono/diheme cytochrome c family protein
VRIALALLGASWMATAALAHDRIATTVSWTREIGPLVQARCASCHRPDGRAPMSLVTYEDARPWARAIREEVLARRMPKWHAARGYGDFANDPSLSDFEISMIAEWVDGGTPKDPPKRAATLPAGPPPARIERIVPPAGARELTVRCTDRTLPDGELLAVRPQLARGGWAGISVLLPSGRREIVAWVRDFDPEFAETYWLRTPIPRRPGRRLLVETSHPCTLGLVLK